MTAAPPQTITGKAMAEYSARGRTPPELMTNRVTNRWPVLPGRSCRGGLGRPGLTVRDFAGNTAR